jgi:hypothetical protein
MLNHDNYIDYNADVKNYKTISVVRNPFDMLVSYYWWSFNVEESISETFNERYLKNKRNAYSLCPQESDNIETLRSKISDFYNLPANYSISYRESDSQISVLKWLSLWQNEFFLDDIDYWIKFENIKDSFKNVCNQIDIGYCHLPRLKSGIRKSNDSFMEYFNDDLHSLVYKNFSNMIDKFNY